MTTVFTGQGRSRAQEIEDALFAELEPVYAYGIYGALNGRRMVAARELVDNWDNYVGDEAKANAVIALYKIKD